MKNYSLVFLILFGLLFVDWSSVDDIVEPSYRSTDLLAAEGYVSYIVNTSFSTIPEPEPEPIPTPENCPCDGSGEIEQVDGNTVQCPCGDNCECGDRENIDVDIDTEDYSDYYIVMFSPSTWTCPPCESWKQNEKSKLEDVGIKTTILKNDNPDPKWNISSFPTFYICDSNNKTFYKKGIIKKYETADQIIKRIKKLD